MNGKSLASLLRQSCEVVLMLTQGVIPGALTLHWSLTAWSMLRGRKFCMVGFLGLCRVDEVFPVIVVVDILCHLEITSILQQDAFQHSKLSKYRVFAAMD